MAEKKVEQPQKSSWKERNIALKTLKVTGPFGWLHLVVGQNKITKRKFLRLKRYMNWFSIPDSGYLAIVQQVLAQGAKELSWAYDSNKDVKIQKVKGEAEEPNAKSPELDEDIKEFVRTYPDFTKKVLALNLQSKDIDYVLDSLQVIDEVAAKSGERLKLAFKEILKKLSKEKDEKGLNGLGDLMNKWSLLQVTSISSAVRKRIEDLHTYEEMIHDDKTYEIKGDKSIHRMLEKSMWIIDERYWIVRSNKSLRNFIGDEVLKKYKLDASKRPDFVCVATGDNKLIIIEIKRPGILIGKAEIDQAEFYQMVIDDYKADKYSAIEVIIVGNKLSEEAKKIERLRKNIKLRTYQDFLDDANKRYQKYLEIIEEE